MQKGDFRPQITMPEGSEWLEEGWVKTDETSAPHPMTEEQGERIIELLETLVSLSQGSLDEKIAEDIKRHSISYLGGF